MKWFYNLKTSIKLVSAFLVMAIVIGFVGLFGMLNIDQMNTKVNEMYNLRLVPNENMMNAQLEYQRLRLNLMFMHVAETEQEKNKNFKTIDSLKQSIEKRVADYGNRTFSQREHEDLYNKVKPSWVAFQEVLEQAIKLSSESTNKVYMDFVNGEYKAVGDEFNDNLNNLISFNSNNALQASIDTDVQYDSSRTTIIIVIIASMFASIGFGYVISQIIARPLNRVVELIKKVAHGDLRETSDIKTKDEIGQLAGSINDMVLSLRSTVSGIQGSSESVSAAAQQISASTEEVAYGNTNQANAAQTMNDLFRELSAAINSVARSAEQASELSNQTTDIAQNGGQVLRSSIDGMNRVNQQMSRLEEDSNKIGEIIEVIDDIADQTNLLALNAAIEAARAGDQGRGFAVVADEVRKLAERSSEATKQITSIIKGMQENTNESVKAVEEGVDSSQKTGEAFAKIISMVNESADKVMEIAAASEEQAAQSSEVMRSIESISAVTQEAAASSEETASTAQSLAKLAEELNNSIAIFKVN